MEATGQVNSGGKISAQNRLQKQTEAGLSLHLCKDARVECVNSRRRSEGVPGTTATSLPSKDTCSPYHSLKIKTKALIDLHMANIKDEMGGEEETRLSSTLNIRKSVHRE